MKGDFSRYTFNPKKRYSGVLMQQGRVQLDADWNESQAIDQYHTETNGTDIIGACGTPFFNDGFRIILDKDENLKKLLIGEGRFYVDGILCENDKDFSYYQQPDYPNPPNIVEQLRDYKTSAGIFYLDVWQRHVTSLEDSQIKEVALGGPDTATRIKTIWQVKFLPISHNSLKKMKSCRDEIPEWTDLVKSRDVALNAHTIKQSGSRDKCLLPPSAGYQRLENQLYRIEIHKGGPLGNATFKWSRDNGIFLLPIDKISGREVTVHDSGSSSITDFVDNTWVEIVDESSELKSPEDTQRPLVQVDRVDKAKHLIVLKTAPSNVDGLKNPRLRRWDQTGISATEDGITTSTGWIALEDGIEVQFSGKGDFKNGDYWQIPARTATGEIEWPPYEVPNKNPEAQPPMGIKHHYCRLAILGFISKRNADHVIDNLGANSIESLGKVDLKDFLSTVSTTRPEAISSIENTKFEILPFDCRKIFPPLTGLPAVHVIATSWMNDDMIKLDDLIKKGLSILLDDSIDQQSVSGNTMIVAVESFPANSDSLDLSFILEGSVTISDRAPSVIKWMPKEPVVRGPNAATTLHQQLERLIIGRSSIRMRIVLKGHAIWSKHDDKLYYLDGQVFGTPGKRADRTPRTDLIFPSGNGQKASDFESWCQIYSPVNLLRIKTVNFKFREDQITVDMPPLSPVEFPLHGPIETIEFILSREVVPEGLGKDGTPQSVQLARTRENISERLRGDISAEGNIVNFRPLDRLVKGSYELTVFGTKKLEEPAVTAIDGVALDGDYSGKPGGDFKLKFNIVG